MDSVKPENVVMFLSWAMLSNDGNWRTTHQIQELWRQKGVLIDARAITNALAPLVAEGKVECRTDTIHGHFIRHYWRKAGE